MTPVVAAAVIHHRRYPEVLATLRSLVRAGIPAGSVVVVDNSEDEETTRALERTSEGWRVHAVDNQGYGAAANTALGLCPGADLLLVVTHETLIDGASVDALAEALGSDARVAAAGPGTLIGGDGRVWSRGGMLSRHLLLPRHRLEADAPGRATSPVDWLDGACVMYRADALRQNPFREDFFLYFEETELHTRLRARGWDVVTVAGATARQSTDGMPAYWGCRNVVLFQREHGSRTSRLVAPVYFTLRTMVAEAVRGDWRGIADAPRGLHAGYRAARPRSA